jgi:hypothetical protein
LQQKKGVVKEMDLKVDLYRLDKRIVSRMERCVLPDGSLRLLVYDDPAPPGDLLTLSPAGGYYADNTKRYTVTVKLPPAPVLRTVAIVIRTSANKYLVIVSDRSGTVHTVCNTYGAIDDCLRRALE